MPEACGGQHPAHAAPIDLGLASGVLITMDIPLPTDPSPPPKMLLFSTVSPGMLPPLS